MDVILKCQLLFTPAENSTFALNGWFITSLSRSNLPQLEEDNQSLLSTVADLREEVCTCVVYCKCMLPSVWMLLILVTSFIAFSKIVAEDEPKTSGGVLRCVVLC